MSEKFKFNLGRQMDITRCQVLMHAFNYQMEEIDAYIKKTNATPERTKLENMELYEFISFMITMLSDMQDGVEEMLNDLPDLEENFVLKDIKNIEAEVSMECVEIKKKSDDLDGLNVVADMGHVKVLSNVDNEEDMLKMQAQLTENMDDILKDVTDALNNLTVKSETKH